MSGKTGETLAVEHDVADGENVAKALEHVSDIVKSVLAGTGGAASSEDEEDTAEAIAKARKSFTPGAMLKALGMKKGADYDAAMSKLQKAFGLSADEKFQNAQPPIAKAKKPAAADPDEDEDDDTDEEEPPAKPFGKKAKKGVDPSAPSAVDELMSAISKAKHFTPERVDTLKKLMETLKAMLADVEQIPQGTMPVGNTPTGTAATLSGINADMASLAVGTTKSISETPEFATAVAKAVKEALAPLNESIEAIKKARPAPASGGDNTESTTVKKNLWSGVL